jgi:hypothetical protein
MIIERISSFPNTFLNYFIENEVQVTEKDAYRPDRNPHINSDMEKSLIFCFLSGESPFSLKQKKTLKLPSEKFIQEFIWQ